MLKSHVIIIIVIVIIIIIPLKFISHQCQLMVLHWSSSDSKSTQASRTLLSIMADLNAVVWMVSTRSLISKSSSPFTNPLGIIPGAIITIGITVTFMFHSLFCSLARSRYLSFFSLSFNFTPVVSHYSTGFFIFFFVEYHED